MTHYTDIERDTILVSHGVHVADVGDLSSCLDNLSFLDLKKLAKAIEILSKGK